MKQTLTAAALALVFSVSTGAQEDDITIERPVFNVFHEFGSIRSATEQESFEFRDLYLSRSGMMVNFKATRNERLTIDALLGGVYWNPSFNENVSSANARRYFAATAPRAQIGYALGGTPEEPFVQFTGGLFQHKYNDYARNLGEYMFRATAYPTQVVTGGLTWVDVNRASVTGLKASHRINETFSHDLIASVETEYLPNYDLTLSYMAKANVNNVLKVGLGVQLSRIIPIRPSITNPDLQYNRYFTINGVTYVDDGSYYSQRLQKNPGADSAHYVRGRQLANDIGTLVDLGMSMPQALDSIARREGGNPTSYDHFKASSINPVAVFSFNPKPLLGFGPERFNDVDLVLYGEASLLGIENQPVLYENRLERTVAMIGFNVPTLKMLDVLAVELEWFGSRQPNSSAAYQQSIGKTSDNQPLPLPLPSVFSGQLATGYDPADWKKDDIKWSVFAQRTLVRGLALQVQVASDNARGWVFPEGKRYWSYFRSPSDWYWMMKVSAGI